MRKQSARAALLAKLNRFFSLKWNREGKNLLWQGEISATLWEASEQRRESSIWTTLSVFSFLGFFSHRCVMSHLLGKFSFPLFSLCAVPPVNSSHSCTCSRRSWLCCNSSHLDNHFSYVIYIMFFINLCWSPVMEAFICWFWNIMAK